jgi:DNA polymerase-3 subunit delta
VTARTDFAQAVRSKPSSPLPVCVLVSLSPHLLQEAVVSLQQQSRGPSSPAGAAAKDLNCETFSALRSGDLADALQAARTLPLFATGAQARRFIVFEALHKLPAKDHPLLLAYLAAPADHTTLCLTGEKCDMRTKLGQFLGKTSYLFSLPLPRPSDMARWAQQRAAQIDLRLHPEAAGLLADLVGTDLGLMVQSLTKLQLYVDQGTAVTAQDVAAIISRTRHQSVFELTDALGQRNFARASSLMRSILSGGESALLVLTMLVRQLRQLLSLKMAVAQPGGCRRAELATLLGVRSFVVETLEAQAAQFTLPELYAALDAAAAADQQLKASRLPHGLIIDSLLLQVAGSA